MRTLIETTCIGRLTATGHQLLLTDGPGEIQTGITKSGDREMARYDTSSFILADKNGNHIVGPIDIDAALDLAIAVCEGNSRALTQPQAIHVLATALLCVTTLAPQAEHAPAAVVPEPMVH